MFGWGGMGMDYLWEASMWRRLFKARGVDCTALYRTWQLPLLILKIYSLPNRPIISINLYIFYLLIYANSTFPFHRRIFQNGSLCEWYNTFSLMSYNLFLYEYSLQVLFVYCLGYCLELFQYSINFPRYVRSSINIIFMQLQEKSQQQGCNCEEESEVLLSDRMDALNPAPIQAKSLLSLQNITQTLLPPPLQSIPQSKENFIEKSIKSGEKCNDKSRLKSSQMKRTSASKKESYSVMDNVRLFQIGEVGQGRRSVMTEVKGLRVSEFTGRGLLILPNGKKYEGEWIQGNLIGEAKISYPNGDIYLGGMYNYEKHGKGYLYYNSGEKYEGEFSGGDFHGEGVFYDKDGKVKYDGQWRRGKMTGK